MAMKREPDNKIKEVILLLIWLLYTLFVIYIALFKFKCFFI